VFFDYSTKFIHFYNAGHVTLNDETYNIERNIATGNPYKKLIADLISAWAAQLKPITGSTQSYSPKLKSPLTPWQDWYSSFKMAT